MGTLLFFVMFASLGVVVHWFIQNDLRDSEGDFGALGVRLSSDQAETDKNLNESKYRVRRERDQREKSVGEKTHIGLLVAKQKHGSIRSRQSFQARSTSRSAEPRRSKYRSTPKKVR